ncbi:MAG TPA: ATP-binding cassette domain-containing protein [Terriglobales bacterium]|jgi:molybdate transport system ATP-binding protein
MLEVAIRKQRRGMAVEAAFTLTPGAALGLFGPSGAGKSTVLECIAGLQSPDAGQVRWNAAPLFPPPLPLHRRPLGYLTQEPRLFPHLTVGENVEFGVACAADERAWLEELRRRLRLEECWTARATHISGGQARRVALARMLARRPPLLLLDEPFAGLDRAAVRELTASLLDWRATLGFALLVVDHNPDVLRRLCPETLVMLEGRVLRRGSWTELAAAPDPRLRALLAPV